MIPSILVIIELLLPSIRTSLATTANASAARRLKGISFTTVLCGATIGYISADAHKIKNTLAILLPNTFPIAIPVFHWILAKTLTNSSGAEVQKATIVSQITIFGMLSLFAIEVDPSTSKSAHFIKNKNHTTKSR